MARPRKSGLEYFPFDVDFFQDEKVVCIAGEFGLKGEMVAIRLLCAIYRQGYFALWDEQLKFKLAKELMGVSAELIEQVVQRLVKWGFFDKALFDSAKVLTSPGIQRRYFDAVRKRNSDTALPYLLEPLTGPETVSAPKTPVSGVKNPLNKSKYIKSKSNDLPKAGAGGAGKTEKTSLEKPDMDGFVAELKASSQWQESVAKNYGLAPGDIPGWLDRYLLFCRCEGVEHSSLREVKSHFNRWLPVKIQHQREHEHRTNHNNAGNRRPGDRTDPTASPGFGLIL